MIQIGTDPRFGNKCNGEISAIWIHRRETNGHNRRRQRWPRDVIYLSFPPGCWAAETSPGFIVGGTGGKILAMRLSLSVNDRPIAKAALNAKGWLGAYVNLSGGFGAEPSARTRLAATDVSENPNSVQSTWESVPLSVGDRVEIEVLADGESDAPVIVTWTAESPKNLFSDVEHARLLLEAVRVAIRHCVVWRTGREMLSRQVSCIRFGTRLELFCRRWIITLFRRLCRGIRSCWRRLRRRGFGRVLREFAMAKALTQSSRRKTSNGNSHRRGISPSG
jgi:hypothetical protein